MTLVHPSAETAVRLQQAGISTGGCIPAVVSQSVQWGGQKKADSVKISKGFNICTCSWEGSLCMYVNIVFFFHPRLLVQLRVWLCAHLCLWVKLSKTQGERSITNFICALYFVCVQVLGFCTGEYVCVCAVGICVHARDLMC